MIGGGNTAVEEALFLTNFASSVTVVHRRDRFRAEKILQDRLFRNPKIAVIWDTVLEEVTGGENPLKVSGVVLRNVKTGTITERRADGVNGFLGLGMIEDGFGIDPDRVNGADRLQVVAQPTDGRGRAAGFEALLVP